MRWGEIATLTDPSSCPGLRELIGSTTTRLLPSLPAATFITWTNSAATVTALVVFFLFVRRSTRSFIVAGAVTIALATLPVFQNTLGFSGAAVLAAAAIAFSCLQTRPIFAVLALALLAALAPPLTMPAALASGWLIWTRARVATGRRAVRAAFATFAPACAAVTTIWMLPHLPRIASADAAGCIAPVHAIAMPSSAISNLLTMVGPLALALALFGAFAMRSAIRVPSTWPALLLACLPLAIGGSGTQDLTSVLMPTVVAIWWLAAVGLNEVRAAVPARAWPRLAVFLLAAALPILEATHHPVPVASMADQPNGQEALSRSSFARLISETPTTAAIVVDDAVTDVLERSLQIATPSGAVRRVVSSDPADVRLALRSARVFVFPRAALALQHQGFALDSAVPGVTGLSEIRAAGACTPMTSTWRPVGELTKAGQLALVAARPDARGPLVVYLTGLDVDAPAPRDWPARALRGFDQHTFDTRRDEDRRLLREDIATDGAPAGDPIFQAPIVTRVEIWRVPDAPSILPVRLGRPPAAAIAYNRTAGDLGDVALCPSFDHAVARIEMPIK